MSTPTATAPASTATANGHPARARQAESLRDGVDQWFDVAQQILDTQRRIATAWVELFRLDR